MMRSRLSLFCMRQSRRHSAAPLNDLPIASKNTWRDSARQPRTTAALTVEFRNRQGYAVAE
ncbi:MAG TPA: hypothetical protein VGM05_16210 [Planctomycetaceae bacterium]|jgi:hypothetical protein